MIKKNVALVLGSGGARGMAHIGVIEELEKRGYNITSISGSSIGALVAGVYASGKLQAFKEWMLTMTKSEIYRLLDFTMNLGVVKMDKTLDEIRHIIGDWKMEDLNIDTRIIAADINGKQEFVFKKGLLFDAIRASIAYPTVVTPHKIKNRLFVDGGVVNPLPVNRVKRTDGDILMAVDLSADTEYVPMGKYKQTAAESSHMSFTVVKTFVKKWRKDSIKEENHNKWSYLKLIDESLNMMLHQIIKLTLEQYPPDMVVSVSQKAGALFDYYRAEELIEHGRSQARNVIDRWEKKSD